MSARINPLSIVSINLICFITIFYSGWEHVQLYAIIKGVRSENLKEIVASKLNEVGLSEFDSKRLSSGYSGGMKRKLSVACATIGAPKIVFLDEPSTGKVIQSYRLHYM